MTKSSNDAVQLLKWLAELEEEEKESVLTRNQHDDGTSASAEDELLLEDGVENNPIYETEVIELSLDTTHETDSQAVYTTCLVEPDGTIVTCMEPDYGNMTEKAQNRQFSTENSGMAQDSVTEESVTAENESSPTILEMNDNDEDYVLENTASSSSEGEAESNEVNAKQEVGIQQRKRRFADPSQ